MAKIPSNASPINFGSNDTLAGIRQLGSTVKEGTPVTSTNITTLLENVIDGLYANNVNAGGNAKLPIAGELNGLFYSVFGLLAHIQQNGIQEYNANIEYPAFALAKSVDGEALYQSKVNLNKGNALTDTTKWLSLCNISDFAIFSKNQVGDLKLSAVSSDHSNWLICDGRAISRTQYSNLFTAIGSAFGSGDGSTTFNIPDLRGKVAGGIGQGSGLTNRTLGNNVGAETHSLTANQNGSHTHTIQAADVYNPTSAFTLNDDQGDRIASSDNIVNNTNAKYRNYSTLSSGAGDPHNNMQPTLFAGNYFIYAG